MVPPGAAASPPAGRVPRARALPAISLLARWGRFATVLVRRARSARQSFPLGPRTRTPSAAACRPDRRGRDWRHRPNIPRLALSRFLILIHGDRVGAAVRPPPARSGEAAGW